MIANLKVRMVRETKYHYIEVFIIGKWRPILDYRPKAARPSIKIMKEVERIVRSRVQGNMIGYNINWIWEESCTMR